MTETLLQVEVGGNPIEFSVEPSQDKSKLTLKILKGDKVLFEEDCNNRFWTKTSFTEKAFKRLKEQNLFEKKILKEAKNQFFEQIRNLGERVAEAQENEPIAELLEKTSLTKIHPAIDFTENRCFLGLNLPFKVGSFEHKLFALITDEKEVIPLNEFNERGIHLANEPFLDDPQWLPVDVKRFINYKEEEVSFETIFRDLKRIYQQFMDFSNPKQYSFLPIFVIGTYFHRLFHAYPYVFLSGFKESGKSKCTRLTVLVSFNGEMSSNQSVSSLFRGIQSNRPTLGLDEAENLKGTHRGEEIRNILLGGYEKGNAVYRVEEQKIAGVKSFVRKRFENFCPKVIGNIRGLEPVLESRVVKITMVRTDKKQGDEEVLLNNPAFPPLRNKLYLLLMSNWTKVRESYATIEKVKGLSNRAWQIWKPIIAIASLINKEVYTEMQEFAIAQEKEKKQEDESESFEMIVLEKLLRLVDRPDWYPVKTIKDFIIDEEELESKYVTGRRVGGVLSKFNFKNRRKFVGRRQYFLTPEEVLETAQKYMRKEEIERLTGKKGEPAPTKVHEYV